MQRHHATPLKSLSPNRAQALELVAAGARTSDVASTLGVHRSTVWKWRQDPDFEGALLSIREEAQEILTEGVRNLAARAVFVLGELMSSPDPRTRLAASKTVLGSYARLRRDDPPEVPGVQDLTEEEEEEKILRLWAHLQRIEAGEPGFIASNPGFLQAQLWAMEIEKKRRGEA